VGFLGTLQPTDAQVGTQIRFLGTSPNANLTPAQVTDIAPIKASFNNTYEFGYKGIVNNRLRLAVDLWQEKRGDVGNPAGLATPNVYWDSLAVRQYLQAALIPAIAGALQQQGMPAPQAQATAQAFAPRVAGGVAQPFAALPLGIVSFNSPTFASARDIFATYTTYNKTVTVAGLDLAGDLVTDNNWTFSGTYSMVLRCKKPGVESMLHCGKGLVYPNVTSSNQLPLMLNAPDNKMTLAAKYHDENKGWGFETRARYANGYPVNSGVYTTGVAFPRGGTAGTYFYDAVNASTLVDVNVSKRFHTGGAREIFWSLNGENVFNHPYRTLPGMPLIGRMVVTRLQYQF
jgi:iron complex outermembrane receptor protein